MKNAADGEAAVPVGNTIINKLSPNSCFAFKSKHEDDNTTDTLNILIH